MTVILTNSDQPATRAPQVMILQCKYDY